MRGWFAIALPRRPLPISQHYLFPSATTRTVVVGLAGDDLPSPPIRRTNMVYQLFYILQLLHGLSTVLYFAGFLFGISLTINFAIFLVYCVKYYEKKNR